ncbi:MAG: phosphoribosyl-AMP cyclohydrolase / phosphoribosyl-ATP pyrophosphohydrolase, partial [Chloroflexota bacterium]|nr:phosphoribosyl-AMP cyclohydrolase / phosphoribosyl-ATP pyrophosphohydrolase [Chloroflexota bacterium]
MNIADVRFDERGLVPAIVQDAGTGTVLMLAWMDRDAIEATGRTGEVHFHSRSRDALWKKGETSGNTLHAVDLRIDCDGDAVLVRAHPKGPVCHTGSATCWGTDAAPPLAGTLSELAALLRERKRDLPDRSYSAELFKKGRGAIAQKVGEEALELALA